jgi:hypothetical protein
MASKSFALSFFTATTCRKLLDRLNIRIGLARAFFAFAAFACSTNTSHADEGGLGFWFPGLFGSLAAAPQVPGWAIAILDLYKSGERGRECGRSAPNHDQQFAREREGQPQRYSEGGT